MAAAADVAAAGVYVVVAVDVQCEADDLGSVQVDLAPVF